MNSIETPTGGFLDGCGCVCDHTGRLRARRNAAGEICCWHCLAVWYPDGGTYRLTNESWHLLNMRRRCKARLEKTSFGEMLVAVLAILTLPFGGPDDYCD